ncbi:MAG: nitroreductase [Deltaproteobacteria bacterium]|nr:nitroreductase [Deltaproteobacteria bacterium]
MDVFDAVGTRKSTRGFKPDQIPESVLKDILETALWTPSWGNTQPWEIYVAGGKTADQIRAGLAAKLLGDEPKRPDLKMPETWPEEHTRRYMDVAKDLFGIMGVSRDDADKRQAHYVNMFQGFGAPVFVYVGIQQDLGHYSVMDCGAVLQTICLLAQSRGVSSCILAALCRYPEVVRAFLPIPEDHRIVMAVALGYEAAEAPANRFRSSREPADKVIRWSID